MIGLIADEIFGLLPKGRGRILLISGVFALILLLLIVQSVRIIIKRKKIRDEGIDRKNIGLKSPLVKPVIASYV